MNTRLTLCVLSTVGDRVYTLVAVDSDGDTVTFGIDDYTGTLGDKQGDGFDYFNVDASTGHVTVKQKIDFETVTSLFVLWTLTAGGQTTSPEQVVVFISNVNDNAPEFEFETFRLPDSIKEGSVTSDDVIFTVTATDKDDESAIRYEIVDAHNNWPCNGGIFEINAVTGAISLKVGEKLDFEVRTQYTICIKATDSGKPGSLVEALYAWAKVDVNVQDVEDTAPVFGVTNYDKEIPEDAPVGSTVLTVEARDGDRGVIEPNDILYSLIGGDNKFEIDNTTGTITVKESLDREQNTSLTFTVEAQEIRANGTFEKEPSSSEIEITIQIGDVDDEPARFSSPMENVELTENSPPGSFVLLNGLTVEDIDQPPNNQFYLRLGGPDADAFKIQSSLVVGQALVDVRVEKEERLDFEKNRTLSFKIYAENKDGDQLYNTATIYVTVVDQNDETPTFSRQEYTFQINENSQGDFVGDVDASDDDSEPYSQIQYQLYGQGSNPQFEMNQTTGEITTREGAELDYEAQSVYFFTCVASDGQRSGTATVQIELKDENDNAPEFSPASYTTQLVEENTAPVLSLLTVSATDRDNSQNNSKITYSLWNDSLSDRFTIDPEEGVISLQQELDFEGEGPFFELLAIATDSGDVPQSANATVTVVIQDMNDHSPRFTEAVYYGSIEENARRGETVLQVTATDADKAGTVNSRIDYFFSDDSVSDFRINIGSGEITVNSLDLDREIQSSYILKVNAIDRGEPVKNGSCYVNITIVDVNDEPPEFIAQGPVTLYENATSGSLVTTVTATDPDKTADLSYSIVEEVGYGVDGKPINGLPDMFWINNSTGEIFTEDSELDRETLPRFEIKVRVEDRDAVGDTQTDELTLTVSVLDVNDNTPRFGQAVYTFTVSENAPLDSVISTTISATDNDEGNNGQITFELADDVDSLMRIDPETGFLFVNGTFDREKYSSYTVTVLALDDGDPVLTGNATIKITITDVNDNDPEFDLELTNTTIAINENYPNETILLRVFADDADESTEFGSVTYKITAGNPDGIFTIDETEGFLMISGGKELDRETEDTHRLTISATDGFLSATIEVIITVLDVNDNAPVFTSGSNEISIQESVVPGQLVTTVTATDRDKLGTDNTKVEYFITAGNDKEHFVITTVNGEGEIRTNGSLSNRVGVYSLHIVAMDSGTPPLESKPFILNITVTDVNDDTPEIISPQNAEVFYIPENYTGFVLNVEVIDTDAGKNGIVGFEFVPTVGDGGRDDEFFYIDPNVGSISITETTDRETKEMYYLQVKVSDKGEFPLSATVSFTVQVTDSDDNDPVFWTPPSNPPTLEFSVHENDDSAVIGSVDIATDADQPENQHIYYFIVDGNEQSDSAFALNKTTGQLSMQKPVDREENQTFSLVVKVTSNMDYVPEGRIPYDSNDQTLLEVMIQVLDENDNGPVFEKTLYTGGAKYNAEYGSDVIQVKAIDSDSGDFDSVTYTLISEKYTDTDGNDQTIPETFDVNPVSGWVITQRVFEKGDAGHFTLVIQAEDSLNAAFKDETTVSIYLYSEDQQVEMTIFKSTDEVRGYLNDFIATIQEIILKYGDLNQSVKRAADTVDPVIVIDDIQILVVGEDPKPGWSVMKFHAVNKVDNTIIAPKVIVDSIDNAYEYTEVIRGTYGVDEIVIAVPPTEPPPDLTWIQWLLVGVACALLVIVVGLVATNCIMTSSYRRKLRAATAGVYEHLNPESKNAIHAPNTNKFSAPGSNPVYNRQIDDGFENRYNETPEAAETAEEEDKKEQIGNGHVQQIPEDSKSEEQELVLEMYDDSRDYDEVADNETGDRLLMEVLQDYDQEKKGQVNLPEFANLTITEI